MGAELTPGSALEAIPVQRATQGQLAGGHRVVPPPGRARKWFPPVSCAGKDVPHPGRSVLPLGFTERTWERPRPAATIVGVRTPSVSG